MSDFQTFLALAVLIYVLCVIVQAVQEALKSVLSMKAKTMSEVINRFMGDQLTLEQVTSALKLRGLSISALEHFNKDDFRYLLDGVQFTEQQLQQIPKIVALQNATIEQLKDHISASFDGALAGFQKSYAKYNKRWVIGISFAVVLLLNASVIKIYKILSVNEKMSQAIVASASTIVNTNRSVQNGTASNDPTVVLFNDRKAISDDLQKYPILLRTAKYPDDIRDDPANDVCGLLVMGILVSLGAPFWNDVLKSATGINNALNSGGQNKAP